MHDFQSQAGQDRWVVEFFNSKRDGWFLEIGANDGVKFSNTYFLETHLGWDGICVEADPTIFERLRANRRCDCVNAMVSDRVEILGFLSDDLSGRVTTQGGQMMQARPIGDILEECGAPRVIDYMSLDVEGMEAKVLAGFPFHRHDVIIMTVEHNLYLGDAGNKNKIAEILTSNGYIVYRENVAHENCAFEDWYVNGKYNH